MQSYSLRPTVLSDAESLNALYKKVTGIERTLAQWRWEWLEGPLGPAPSWVIVETATRHIVGHHGVIPVPLVLGSESVKGARTENSMVDPDHRSRFIYPAYEAQLLAELSGKFDVIFTTAGKGAPGIVRKRLGYIELGQWRTFSPGFALGHLAGRISGAGALVCPLAGFLERRTPRGVAIVEITDPSRVAAIWTGARRSERLAPDRTAQFLSWRVLRHPKTKFRVGVFIRDGTDHGAIIWRDDVSPGATRQVTIEDLFTVDDDPQSIGAALAALAALYRGKGARILLRTLDDNSPLATVGRQMTPQWAAKSGAGSPVFVYSRHRALTEMPWTMTQLLTQGN